MKRATNSARHETQKMPRISREEYGNLGIIESVSLQNFMCHENLQFDFHPHMNFVIGQNGSGKSAVLTGIILALGGKSSATGRYGNLKGFIKTNKHTAIISVKLKNCGDFAYKPDLYGEKILVERILHSNGTAQYKIKADNGQIVSTAREELRHLLDNLGIQIENPTTVLTQEISRSFLLTKNSKMLFKLFYEGTNLKKVEDEYHDSIKSNEDLLLEIQNKRMLLPEIEKGVKRLKTYLENSDKIPNYKNELLWAGVIELENKRDLKKQEYEKAKRNLMSVKQNLNKYKNEGTALNNELDKLSKENDESKLLIAKHRTDLSDLIAKRELLKPAIIEIKGSLERQSREVKRRNDEISAVQNSVNEIRQKNENTIRENKRLQEEEMEKLADTILKKKQQLAKLKNIHEQLTTQDFTIQSRTDSMNEDIQNLSNRIKITEREITQLCNGITNKVNVYGLEMTRILIDIRKAVENGEFEKEPKGPIGLYVEVEDPIWNFAVQCCLGVGFLKSFCCDNLHDCSKLMEIFSRHYAKGAMRPYTYTSPFVGTVYDVTEYKARSLYPTLFDLLRVKDPVIANCLIDNKRIENIIMIKDTKEATNYMMKSPPKNCTRAFTLDGNEILLNTYRFFPCRKKKDDVCLLKTIHDSDISQRRQLLESLCKRRQEADKERNLEYQARNTVRQDLKKNQNDMSLASAQLKSCEKTLEKVKEELNSYDEQRDIKGMLADLEELLKEKEKAEERITSLQKVLNNRENEFAAINIDEKRNELKEEVSRYLELSNKLGDFEKQKANLDSKISKLQSELSNLSTPSNSLLEEHKHIAHLTELAVKDAEEICPRINTDRSSETIRKLLEEMEKTLEQEMNCSREDLREQYEEKYQNLTEFKRNLETDQLRYDTIKNMLERRKKRFVNVRKNTALCLSLIFTTTLKKNKFDGDLEILFDEKELIINAKPEKRSNRGNQNYHQLSGGERSFITIAFLLALWDRVEMPFRILDEYDVYMDSDNRHLSVNLLTNTAKSKKNIQYIFLSPLDLPPMEDSVDVKIHKMSPPKRKKTHSEL